MKNVRLLLSAFAIISIVGSALAFKPYGGAILFLPDPNTGLCTVNSMIRYVEDPAGIPKVGRLGSPGVCQILIVIVNA